MARRRKQATQAMQSGQPHCEGAVRAAFERCLGRGVTLEDVEIVTVPSPADHAYAAYVARLIAGYASE